MLLTEFDEKAYKKRLYRDGVQDGREQGERIGLERGIKIGAQINSISMVCAKLKKGNSVPEIADALEKSGDEIAQICQVAERVTPKYDAQAIYEYLHR